MKIRPIVLLLLLAAAPAGAQQASVTHVTHLLARATYGVRPADVAVVQRSGIAPWLEEQLHPERIADDVVTTRLRQFTTLDLSIPELAERFPTGKQARDTSMAANPRRILIELVAAKLLRASQSNRQLEEVMTDFWFNHFNVFWAKGPLRYMVADYEQRAIRPYVFGSFYDMLKATAQHPAMLVYLDNATSNARRGINENYARELLELHTLGVDGGYTQKDVQEVARAFTGWTVQRRDGVRFVFAPRLHDDGAKVVLGHALPAGRGRADGEAVLRILARHPATAHHIARQLIERFVTDEPPADYINEIADVFLKTDGDLRAVTRALFTSPRFYNAPYINTKVKTPFELVASALRVTDSDLRAPGTLLQTLRSLGELPYTEQAPTGFPASSADWVNSGAMLARINFGIAFAQRSGDRQLSMTLGAPAFQMK